MSRSTTVIGLGHLKAALAKAGSDTRRGAEEAVAEEVEAIRADARRIAPHRTGDLERHIDSEADGLHGTVKSKARHAGFVEHGTYKDKAQPYMRPASELARRRLPKRAAEVIRIALESIR